jgi:hypothetical protein
VYDIIIMAEIWGKLKIWIWRGIYVRRWRTWRNKQFCWLCRKEGHEDGNCFNFKMIVKKFGTWDCNSVKSLGLTVQDLQENRFENQMNISMDWREFRGIWEESLNVVICEGWDRK